MARRKGIVVDMMDALVASPWWVGVIAAAVFWSIPGSGVLSTGKGSLTAALSPLFALLCKGLSLWCLLAALISAIKRKSRRKLLDRQSGLDSLKSLSWREFEHLVGEAYRRQGFDVEETGGGGADGGVDLVLRGNRETVLVQCKQWRQWRVGVDKVRELFGVVMAEHSDRGILVTTGTFTKDAISFQVGKPLTLVDGQALSELVCSVRGCAAWASAPAAAPSRPAAALTTVETACPKCGAPMKLRTARRGPNTGSSFYGCTRFPNCRGIRQLS